MIEYSQEEYEGRLSRVDDMEKRGVASPEVAGRIRAGLGILYNMRKIRGGKK